MDYRRGLIRTLITDLQFMRTAGVTTGRLLFGQGKLPQFGGVPFAANTSPAR